MLRRMYCQACGADNTQDARFCNMCGSRFAAAGEAGGPLAAGETTTPDAAPEAGLAAAMGKARNAPNATVLGVGRDHLGGSSSSSSSGGGLGGSPVHAGVAAQGGGRPHAYDPSGMSNESMLGVSLAGIGVRSSRKAWVTIALLAIGLLAAGSFATWLAMGRGEAVADAGHAEPEDPFVIGTPLTTEQDQMLVEEPGSGADPDVDFVTGSGGTASMITTSMITTRRTTPPRTRPPRTTSAAMTNTTGSDMTGASGSSGSTGGGSTSTTMSATTMSDATGSTGTGSTATGSAATGGNATGSNGSTNEGNTSMGADPGVGTTGGGTSVGSTGGIEERDLELELYGSRVRFAVRRYYAARAQTCFDRATRNEPTLSGTVVIAMTIGSDGGVSATSVQRNTTGDTTLGTCLAAQVGSWRLPPPPDGSIQMTMPFSR